MYRQDQRLADKPKRYLLTWTAADQQGEDHHVHVSLIVNIIDDNDNPPEFTLPEYGTSVYENETVFYREPKLFVVVSGTFLSVHYQILD